MFSEIKISKFEVLLQFQPFSSLFSSFSPLGVFLLFHKVLSNFVLTCFLMNYLSKVINKQQDYCKKIKGSRFQSNLKSHVRRVGLGLQQQNFKYLFFKQFLFFQFLTIQDSSNPVHCYLCQSEHIASLLLQILLTITTLLEFYPKTHVNLLLSPESLLTILVKICFPSADLLPPVSKHFQLPGFA